MISPSSLHTSGSSLAKLPGDFGCMPGDACDTSVFLSACMRGRTALLYLKDWHINSAHCSANSAPLHKATLRASKDTFDDASCKERRLHLLGPGSELCWCRTPLWLWWRGVHARMQRVACNPLALDALLALGIPGAGTCMVAWQRLGPFTILPLGYASTRPIRCTLPF